MQCLRHCHRRLGTQEIGFNYERCTQVLQIFNSINSGAWIRFLDFDKRQQEEISLRRAMTGEALLDPYESKNTRKEK